MKRPILPLLETTSAIRHRQEQPCDITFEIPYAERELLTIPEGFFISQRYSDYLYFMEILEIRIERDFCLPYETLDFSVFLFFMLDGHGKFTTGEGRNLSEAHKGTCYLTVNASDRYVLHLEKGTHIMAYIAPRVEWITRCEAQWPLFTDFILDTRDKGQNVAFMHKIAINRSIGKRLIEMWHLSAEQTEDIELQLISQVKGLFNTYYDSMLLAEQAHRLRSEEKIHVINHYLEQHFQYSDIGNIHGLCEKFLLTERTLRRAFAKVNGKTVSNYLNNIRLSHAQNLLLSTTFSVQKISSLCGFQSMNYFCRVFRERNGCSPICFRKGKSM